MRHLTLPALDFIARFLQHILPQGCAKVRYYGIASNSASPATGLARAPLSKSLPLPTAHLSASPSHPNEYGQATH